jgi:hypothetical protein
VETGRSLQGLNVPVARRGSSSAAGHVSDAYSPDRALKLDVYDLGVRLGHVIRNENGPLFDEVEKLRKLSRQGRNKEGGIIKQEDALNEMSDMVKQYDAQVMRILYHPSSWVTSCSCRPCLD